MSTLALQRAIVRMLYDPTLAARVAEDARAALAGVELDESERALLSAWDRRAFGTDPQRRTRTLAALIEEYPASSALVLWGARTAAPLDAFFSSSRFHECVQRGSALALAFGEYLMGLPADTASASAGVVGAAAKLEHGIAGARRATRADPAGRPAAGPRAGGTGEGTATSASRLKLAAGVAVLGVPAGTLTVRQAIDTALAARTVAASCTVADAVVLIASDGLLVPGLSDDAEENLLIHARAEAGLPVTVEQIPAELARVLAAARSGLSPAELHAVARTQGAGVGEDETVIRSLMADGLLALERPR